MSKKILVIEDWEQFQLKLDIALIVNDEAKEKKTPRAVWEERLLKHELDVIEFEGVVKLKSEPHIYKDGQWSEERLIAYTELPMGKNIVWTIKDKLQVFVLKPKKLEVKDERDKT